MYKTQFTEFLLILSNFQNFHNPGHTNSTVELFKARPEKLHREGQKINFHILQLKRP